MNFLFEKKRTKCHVSPLFIFARVRLLALYHIQGAKYEVLDCNLDQFDLVILSN